MYSRKKNRWLKHLDFILLDIISICAALFLAYTIRHGLHSHYGSEEYFRIGMVMVFADLLIVFFGDSYKDVIRRGYLKEFRAAFIHLSLVMCALLLYLFFVQQSEFFSRLTIFWTWVLGFVLMYVLRISLKTWLRRRMMQKENLVSVLAVLSPDTAEPVIKELLNRKYRDFDIAGIILVGRQDNMRTQETGQGVQPQAVTAQEQMPEEICGVPVVATGDDFAAYIKEHVVDEIFVSVNENFEAAESIMESCVRMGITVHQNLTGVAKGGNQVVDEFAGYMVLTSSIKVAAYRELFLKRLMDIVGGLIGLCCTAVMFPFIAVAVKRKSPGPVLFCQERVGKNGRIIKIYKFRSMYMDAEERKEELLRQNEMQGLMFKMKEDPRVIQGVGVFIRKTSLDEFPQFWNVLKGDMSLVGTRPPTIEEYQHYDMHHMVRMSIKPGLTGLWQVSGRNEITDFEEVVKLDTRYIEEWSLNLDIKILLKTIRVVLEGRGE
ncbi:MAG: sugar transferase [Clostridiales bacterium]|nr:sugar transferase [Clostridiales bacterium]